MTNQEVIDRAIASIKPETTRFIELSWDVAEILENYMEANKLKNKDLAKTMEVSPSVISDWLTGMHNFTLRTLGKIEGRLGVSVVEELYKLHLRRVQENSYISNRVISVEAAENKDLRYTLKDKN